MFSGTKNYLIIGQPKSGKTSLARNIMDNITKEKTDMVYINMYNEEIPSNLYDKGVKCVCLDNYTCKDNSKSVTNLLKDKNICVIITIAYALSITNLYFDTIFIPKIEDDYTLKLIHKNFVFLPFETFEKLNNNNTQFLVIDNDKKSFQYYNPNEGIFSSIYKRLMEIFL